MGSLQQDVALKLPITVRVFAMAGNSLLVCPEQMLIEKLKLKLTTKSQIYKCQPELLLIVAHS